MKLSHYSRKPIDTVLSFNQRSSYVGCFKPIGLWVSVDGPDDWPRWCESAEYDGCGPYHYAVDVDLGKVLVVTSVEGLDIFHQEYSATVCDMPYAIDWSAVADDYDGIIIAPCLWERRPTYLWHCGWSCASGCIWNARAVLALTLVEEAER